MRSVYIKIEKAGLGFEPELFELWVNPACMNWYFTFKGNTKVISTFYYFGWDEEELKNAMQIALKKARNEHQVIEKANRIKAFVNGLAAPQQTVTEHLDLSELGLTGVPNSINANGNYSIFNDVRR